MTKVTAELVNERFSQLCRGELYFRNTDVLIDYLFGGGTWEDLEFSRDEFLAVMQSHADETYNDDSLYLRWYKADLEATMSTAEREKSQHRVADTSMSVLHLAAA